MSTPGDGRRRDDGARGIAAEREMQPKKLQRARWLRRRGDEANSSMRSLDNLTRFWPQTGKPERTAERSTPVLFERAGEIAVKQGDDRSERCGVNRVLLP
jgi:hypothetical protein